MRVNLSSIVDKYIGETAKHLTEIFEQASQSPCLLLFDEADSLFAKRTEVSRATDRYANMDVNILLQLVEDYDGVVVLTTNLTGAIDKAFRRRISYSLTFENPDRETRRRIWDHLLSPGVPRARDVDLDVLAGRFEVTGGSIKSMVMHAVLEAARLDTPVTMALLEAAAVHELAKLGKVVHVGAKRT